MMDKIQAIISNCGLCNGNFTRPPNIIKEPSKEITENTTERMQQRVCPPGQNPCHVYANCVPDIGGIIDINHCRVRKCVLYGTRYIE